MACHRVFFCLFLLRFNAKNAELFLHFKASFNNISIDNLRVKLYNKNITRKEWIL